MKPQISRTAFDKLALAYFRAGIATHMQAIRGLMQIYEIIEGV